MDTFDLHQEWILSVPKMSRNRRKQKARLAKVMAEMQLEENEKMNISDIDEEVGKNSGDEGRGPKEEAPKAEAPAELAELQRRMNARNRFLALLFVGEEPTHHSPNLVGYHEQSPIEFPAPPPEFPQHAPAQAHVLPLALVAPTPALAHVPGHGVASYSAPQAMQTNIGIPHRDNASPKLMTDSDNLHAFPSALLYKGGTQLPDYLPATRKLSQENLPKPPPQPSPPSPPPSMPPKAKAQGPLSAAAAAAAAVSSSSSSSSSSSGTYNGSNNNGTDADKPRHTRSGSTCCASASRRTASTRINGMGYRGKVDTRNTGLVPGLSSASYLFLFKLSASEPNLNCFNFQPTAMPTGTNPKGRVTMSVTSSFSGETLTTVVATRNTKVEEVKKMIANDIAKNNTITETETKTKNREDQERRWQLYQLVYGTKELRNMDTLAQSGIRGSEVTMCLIVRSEVDWFTVAYPKAAMLLAECRRCAIRQERNEHQ
jgi:hypothetical protein